MELAGFVVEGLLGRGGMADVWRGRHRLSDQPAAIKVIARDRARDAGFVEGLRREVRAVAGLDHPGIVPVLDAGVVPDDAPAGWTPGSPWLALALAEHGDLGRLGAPLPWPTLRDVLLQMLDGLAHAHAREVIHRDLKPGNVLLRLDDDRLRVMLTDFGIAHVFDPRGAPDAGHSLGTPAYMAPEQLRGEWRDFGPWTDLYALGCMAFELACGAQPYGGTTPLAIATRHLSGPMPRLRPADGTPPGFIAWVRRLMDRDPWSRFGTAAEAAWALHRLPAPSPAAERAARAEVSRRLSVARPADGAETAVDGALAGLAATVVLAPTLASAIAGQTAEPADAGSPDRGPPMPETWYVDHPRRPLVAGVGLGLFGVRARPVVGREAERGALWQALRWVDAEQRAGVVLISGPEGMGRTALAGWLAQRALEAGVADVIRFRFGAMDGAGDGLADGLAAYFRGHGLARDALVDRIRRVLTRRAPERARLIDEVVAPSLARLVIDDEDVQLSPGARRAALRGALALLAARRPLVVLLDDAHWSVDALDLVEATLEGDLGAPVLVVATADAEVDDTDRANQVARLVARAPTLRLGPLSEAAHNAAMQGLLGLSPRLSDAVRRHAAGNPLFAGQIVADWVEQRALVATPDGYALVAGRAPDVPRDLAALAHRRIARVAPGPGPRQALLVAAALGHAVNAAEWRRACAALGLGPPPGLSEALHDAGLTVPAPTGWVFAHGFVRGALLDAARGGGHWAAVHRACADAVHTGLSPAERRARHLLEAGALEPAADALHDATRAAMDRADYRRALRLLDIRVGVMDRAGVPADDVRRALGLSARVNALRFTRRIDEARAAMDAFEQFPVGPEHPWVLAERARVRAGLLSFSGDFRPHFDAYEQAVALYRAAGDVRGEARALHGLGWNQISHGHFARAEGFMLRSRELARAAGLRLDEAWALQGLATARYFGHRPDADDALGQAERAFAEVGFPIGTAMVLADRADHAVLTGDLPRARRHAEAAAELFEGAGSQLVFRTRLTLAMITLHEGHIERAHAAMVPLVEGDALEGLPRQHTYGAAVSGLIVMAYAGDDARFERYLGLAESDPDRRFMAASLRRAMETLAEVLEGRGRRSDAARVWRLVADYWRAVDPERARMCRARADAAAAH